MNHCISSGVSIAALLLSGATSSVGQAASGTSTPAAPVSAAACAGPEFRQFDFWVGEWEVTSGNHEVAGANRITPILSGCVLHEHWRGANGGSDQSFNIYDAAARKWRQTWVADNGVVLLLEGALVQRGELAHGVRRAVRQASDDHTAVTGARVAAAACRSRVDANARRPWCAEAAGV